MQSLEVKFNEALAELKKKASAKKYDDVCQQYMPLTSIEAKLNCVEEALKNVVKESSALGLTGVEDFKDDAGVAILFGGKKTTNKESATPIVKHNGRADNFNENDPLQRAEGKPVQMTETNTPKDICAKGDKALADGLLKLGKITEAEHAKLTGKKPAGYEQLSEQQKKDFNFARQIGISEADAFRVAKLAGNGFKEVSRR